MGRVLHSRLIEWNNLLIHLYSVGPLLFTLYTTPQQQTTKLHAELMILDFSYHSRPWISHITLLAFKTRTVANISNWMYSHFLSLLIFLKLSFSSLVYHNNSLKSVILPLISHLIYAKLLTTSFLLCWTRLSPIFQLPLFFSKS